MSITTVVFVLQFILRVYLIYVRADLFNGSDSHLVQDIGSIRTRKGRCIAFPNIYQHQVRCRVGSEVQSFILIPTL